jgi:hypothetical protein
MSVNSPGSAKICQSYQKVFTIRWSQELDSMGVRKSRGYALIYQYYRVSRNIWIKRPFDIPVELTISTFTFIKTDNPRVLKLIDSDFFGPRGQVGNKALHKWHMANYHQVHLWIYS